MTNTATHDEYLKLHGYTMQRQEVQIKLFAGVTTYYQKRVDIDEYDMLIVEVTAHDYPRLPGGIRYEVSAQLNSTITMNVTLFTLFDKDLVQRLAGIERYIVRLAKAFVLEKL